MPWRLLLLAALLTGCASGSPVAARTAAPTHTATTTPPTATPLTPMPPTATPPRTTVPPTVRPTTKPTAPRATAAGRQFPIRGCKASYGHSHHDYPATDIFAARGCVVVSPVTGRVDEVSTVDHWSGSTNNGADRGGLSFSVVGDDGVRYYGSHLETLTVRAGQRVLSGTQLGTVGDSGSAQGTPTHLHFGLSWPTRPGIWWVRRGEVYPWPYLDSWRAGGNQSPAAEVAREHTRQGDVPPCRISC